MTAHTHNANATPQQIAGQISGVNRTHRAAERRMAAERQTHYDKPGVPGHPRCCICDDCEARR